MSTLEPTIKASLIIGISLLLSVFAYTFNTRYHIVRVAESSVIKLNRISGEVTYIEGLEEYEVLERAVSE